MQKPMGDSTERYLTWYVRNVLLARDVVKTNGKKGWAISCKDNRLTQHSAFSYSRLYHEVSATVQMRKLRYASSCILLYRRKNAKFSSRVFTS